MLKILEDQQGNLVPGKLSEVEQSPVDVQSPKLERTAQPELCREQRPAQVEVSPLNRGKAQLPAASLLLRVHMCSSQKHKGTEHSSR